MAKSKKVRKPKWATLITYRKPQADWSLYFAWELLLFYGKAGLSAGRLTSESCYGEQKDAVDAAEQMARAFGLRIDKRVLIKEKEKGGTLGQ